MTSIIIKDKFEIIESGNVISTPRVNIYYNEENNYNSIVIQGDDNVNIYEYLDKVKEYLKDIFNKYYIKNIYIDNSCIYGLNSKNWISKLVIETDGANMYIKNIEPLYKLEITKLDSDYTLLFDYIQWKNKERIKRKSYT